MHNSKLAVQTQALLKKYNLEPNLINFGQHFLVDSETIKFFIQLLELETEDLVLEIGPGLGYFTEEIAKKAKQITAVEIDKRLKPILNKVQKKYSNINLIFSNILEYKKYDFDIVCGALAYNIFEPLLRQLIYQIKFQRAVFIVSQRFQTEYQEMNNLTALMVDAFFQVEMIKELPIDLFYPRPQYPGLLIKLIPEVKKDKYHFLLREILLQKNRRLRKSLKLAVIKWFEQQGQIVSETEVKEKIKFITQAPETREPIFQVSKEYLQVFIQQLKQF